MIINGLEVVIRLKASNELFAEYASLEDDPAQTSSGHRYIESKAAEKFKIDLQATQAFDYLGATGLLVKFHYGEGAGWQYWTPKNRNRNRTKHDVRLISMLPFMQSGKLMQGDLAFSDNEIIEDEDDAPDGSSDKKGRITITIQRIQSAAIIGAPNFEGLTEEAASAATIKHVKKHGLKHKVTAGENATEAALDSQRDYVPLPGCAGKPFSFNFDFRPKYILQRLGVCPPSPLITAMEPIDLTAIPDDEETPQRQPAEEVDLTGQEETAHRGVKREREEEEEDDGEDLEAQLEQANQRQRVLEARLRVRNAAREEGRRVEVKNKARQN